MQQKINTEHTLADNVMAWPRRALAFAKHHHKKAFLIAVTTVLLLCTSSIAVQAVYPSNRALPGTVVADKLVSFQNQAELRQALQILDKRTFMLKLGSKNYAVTPTAAGLTFA